MPSQLAFAVFSIIIIVAAWRVVTATNVVRAALALVVVLASIAPIFLMLSAEFVAVVQILVYIGAVTVLILFAVMVTPFVMRKDEDVDYKYRWPGLVVATSLFVIIWTAIRGAFGDEVIDNKSIGTTTAIGASLFRDHVLAFEAVSFLLLAVLVGAVALARRD